MINDIPSSLVIIGEILETGHCSKERGWSIFIRTILLILIPGEAEPKVMACERSACERLILAV